MIKPMIGCLCSCCIESRHQLDSGHQTSGCWCLTCPRDERCDCDFCEESCKERVKDYAKIQNHAKILM